MLDEGIKRHQAGRLQDAQEIYRSILNKQPGQPDALHLMGVIAHQIGRHRVAVNLIGEAIKSNPQAAPFHNNIAEAFKALGSLDEARLHYEKAIALKKDYFEAYNNLGVALQENGHVIDALPYYEKALALNPRYAEAHNNLGVSLKELGRFDEALTHFRNAVEINPRYAEAYNNMGITLLAAGLTDQAIDLFKKAIELKADYVDAYNNMGIAMKDKGLFEEELDLYQKALSIKPDYADAHYNLGCALQEHGYMDEALKAFENAYTLKPQDTIKVKIATMLPVIPRSSQEIIESTKQFGDNIDALLKAPVSLAHPEQETENTNFYLAYNGLNVKDLQIKLASFYERACPSLFYTAPHCSARMRPHHGRIKIGLISRFFKNHTVGQYMMGIIAELSRKDFEVVLFTFAHKPDRISQYMEEKADKVIKLTTNLNTARGQIADETLDLLLYADIGMEPFTYFLAFSRLATVQYAFYGHPVTTGIRNVDYFISHEDCETEESERYYSEKLLRLTSSVTYTCYHRAEFSLPLKSRAAFGLDETHHIYICPQSLFKFHPDFDLTLGNILRNDPEGILLIFQGKSPHWTELLIERMQRTAPDAADRILVSQRRPYDEFLSLIALADVMLDTFHFSGGSTTFDGLAVGTPIVTLPGQFMRGRQTYSLYKRMGVMDCVAVDPDDYTRIAVKLATNPDFRGAIKEKILAQSPLVFDDVTMVRELERLLHTTAT